MSSEYKKSSSHNSAKQSGSQQSSEHSRKVTIKKPDAANHSRSEALKGSLNGVTARPKALAIKLDPRAKLRKKLLDALCEAAKPLDDAELGRLTEIDLAAEQDLVRWLQNHDKVIHNDGKYTYKPEHDIANKQQLLQFLKRAPEGTVFDTIKDTYKSILKDIDSLQKEGKIYVVHNLDMKTNILYPVDDSLEHLKVDDDLVKLWHSVKVPINPTELQAAIKAANIKTADFAPVRKRITLNQASKPKAKKYRQQRVVTNVHLPELHQGPQPDQID